MSSKLWYFKYTISFFGMRLICKSCHIFFANSPERRVNVFLLCVISQKVPAGSERSYTCRTNSAKGIEHEITPKGIQLDAPVRKLDRKWGWVPRLGCRLGRKFPDAFRI